MNYNVRRKHSLSSNSTRRNIDCESAQNCNKRILVVGGAGYLGTVLVNNLLERGYNVRVLDILMFGEEPIRQFKGCERFDLIKGDLRHIEIVTKAIDCVNAVIHLAAVVGDKACRLAPERTIETNYLATHTLAEACRYHHVNRFLYASTCSVYGAGERTLSEESETRPLSLYAKTKLQSEQAVLNLQDGDFSPCIMRMSTLHGWSPRMRFDLVVNTMVMNAIMKGVVVVHGGKQWRPQLHIEDAAEAYMRALECPLDRIKGQIFNVGDSKDNVQIIGLGETIARIIPGTELHIEEVLEDERDYRVSFEKIQNILNFNASRSIEGSINTIAASLKKGLIPDPYKKQYYNHFEM